MNANFSTDLEDLHIHKQHFSGESVGLDGPAGNIAFPIAYDDLEAPSIRKTVLVPVTSRVCTIVLAFALGLFVWESWRVLIDIFCPITRALVLRLIVNAVLFISGGLIISRYQRESRRLAVFGNLICGIGVWELTESVIDSVFQGSMVFKLIFYTSCTLVTYSIVVYLERTSEVKVLDSEWFSPL